MSVSNVIPLRPSLLSIVREPLSVTVTLTADEIRSLAFAADLAITLMPITPSSTLLTAKAELECSLAEAGESR